MLVGGVLIVIAGLWQVSRGTDPGQAPGDAAPEVGAAGDAGLELPRRAPGWFPDQVDDTLQRYWDGQAWSGPAKPVPRVDRDQTAAARDEIAEAIDGAAADRDHRSEARDQRADRRAHAAPVADGNAVSDRSAARRDRQAAATDRLHAGDDRQAAAADRRIAALEVSALLMDELTGTYLRGPGLQELGREVIKAHRTGHPFSLAFIDVDGLKATNDSAGHDAGDRLLAQVAQTVASNLREYDVVVRYGGDEFVCGLAEADLDAARQRVDRVSDDLARNSAASASVGLVSLEPGESLEDLIKRADGAMYAARVARLERSSRTTDR